MVNKFNLLKFIIGTITMFFSLLFLSVGIDSPFLCIGSFIIAPVGVYYFNKYINLRKKYYYLGLVVIFIASFIFTGMNMDYETLENNQVANIKAEEVSKPEKDKEDKAEEKGNEVATTVVEEKFTEATVHFINTGNSDAILITQDNKNILIDAGDNDDEELIVTYLKNLGIKKIDCLINTHPDADHCGGLDAVISNFKIGKFLVGNGSSDSKTYTDVINAAADKKLKPSVPLEESKFELTSNSYLQFYNVKGGSDSNESSLVVLFVNGKDKFLLTGDAGEETENKILSKMQDVDVLKVGHHGSKNSTSQQFLDKVTPEHAVILTGKNSYGHPHVEVLEKLKNANIKVHRSDECGDIIFKSTGQGVSTECPDGSFEPNDKESREEAARIAEEQRLAAEKAEQERLEKERLEQERIAAEQAEQARIAEEARQQQAAEEARRQQEAAQQNNVSEMVWLSATGDKYHSRNNCGRMNPNNARQVTLEQAQRSYQRCSKCW